MKNLNIPVGVSDFEKIRKNEYYYIDKSGLIEDLLKRTAEVTLITRPRRFGKTLGMSMLANFFDIRKNSKEIFEGLEICDHQTLCSEWMNQYPTIFVSFRQVDGLNFNGAYDMLTMVISELYKEHLYLLDSDKISEYDKELARQLIQGVASAKDIKSSLLFLTRLMQQYYGKKAVLLIDEYDVPVAKASSHGYYKEMLDVMKGLMLALKDNTSLCFAVITGCLKIAKESIFTGTNNFVSDTITDSRLNEYFGFVQSEIDQMLKDADAMEYALNIKKWYDGYHFGENETIYSPKSVVEAVTSGICDTYWNQTETFEALKMYIELNIDGLKDAVISMMSGEKIPVNTATFANDMTTFCTKDDVLTLLIHLGYLGYDFQAKCVYIPNREVMTEYVNAISLSQWGGISVALKNSNEILEAIWQNKPEKVASGIEQAHFETSHIQYNDENALSYTISLALYTARNYYTVIREMPTGKGFADMVYIPKKRFADKPAIVMELKWNKKAEGAIKQIKEKHYSEQIKAFSGEILLVGINYDKKTKKHKCIIEKYQK